MYPFNYFKYAVQSHWVQFHFYVTITTIHLQKSFHFSKVILGPLEIQNTTHPPSTSILPSSHILTTTLLLFFLIYKLKHFIFLGCCSLVAESCLTLCYPMDCSPQGSMGFPRQEYWSALPFLLPGISPTQGWNLDLLCWQADSWLLSHQESHLLGRYKSFL